VLVGLLPEGSFSRVELSMPSEVGVGEAARFYLRGELVRLPYGVPLIPNFAVALWYEDGPQGSVKAVIGGHEYSIKKKTGLAFLVKPAYVGATVSVSGTVKLEATGTYVFKGLAGLYDEATRILYVDAVDEKRVTAKQPTIPAPTPPPTPPPAPTPTPTPTPAPEIPSWLVATTGVLTVVAIASAAAIVEGRSR
jgi:hypothetical protein